MGLSHKGLKGPTRKVILCILIFLNSQPWFYFSQSKDNFSVQLTEFGKVSREPNLELWQEAIFRLNYGETSISAILHSL